MSGKKKRSVTGEDDSTTAKVPKTVGGGIVEQDGLNESDKFEAIVPGAILPAIQAMAAGVSQAGDIGGSAIVTPVKAPKQFYLLNKQNAEIEKAASFADAVGLKSMMVRLSGVKESVFVIKDFLSDADANSYLKSITNHLPLPVNEGESADKICNAIVPVPVMVSDTNVHASTNNSRQEIVVVDDGSVPYLPIGNESTRVAAGLDNLDPQLQAFRAATIGHGTSIDVMRWRLPECRSHVYAFKLMSGKELYWSHKPQMWMLTCETEKFSPGFIFPPEENMDVHKAMNYCHAAGIRSIPGGDNVIQQIRTRKGQMVDQYLLWGLVHRDKTNEELSDIIKNFVQICENRRLRQAYFTTVQIKMRTKVIDADVDPETGNYWLKLATGARNIRVEEKHHLNEVFLNHDINDIVNLAYKNEGQPPPLWPPHIRLAAFGRLSSSG
jgi:hypothetical protein